MEGCKPFRGSLVVDVKQEEKTPFKQLIIIYNTMKKSIFILTLATMLFGSVNNTNAQDNTERESRRSEMRARQTERLIRDLKLTDEQKAKFEPIYQSYQSEMAALRTPRTGADAPAQQGTQDKKELTDEAATARLQEIFNRQEEQIRQSQQRLDIQKRYCPQFAEFLTPQQLLRVFQPQQNRGPQQGGRGGFGGQGGRGGFGGGPRGGFGGGPQGDF